MKKISVPTSALQEKVSALTSAQKYLLFLLTFILLGSAFYFLQYKPQADRIRKLKSDISDQEKKLRELKQAAADVEVFEKDLAKSEEELAQVLTLLPDQKEIPGLLENVSLLGAEVGLENVLFQPQPEQPFEFYAAIPVRLDLVGTFHELATFFDKISKLDRILKVQDLTVARQKEGSLLQVTCTIVTFRFLEKAAQADVAPKKQ